MRVAPASRCAASCSARSGTLAKATSRRIPIWPSSGEGARANSREKNRARCPGAAARPPHERGARLRRTPDPAAHPRAASARSASPWFRRRACGAAARRAPRRRRRAARRRCATAAARDRSARRTVARPRSAAREGRARLPRPLPDLLGGIEAGSDSHAGVSARRSEPHRSGEPRRHARRHARAAPEAGAGAASAITLHVCPASSLPLEAQDRLVLRGQRDRPVPPLTPPPSRSISDPLKHAARRRVPSRARAGPSRGRPCAFRASEAARLRLSR